MLSINHIVFFNLYLPFNYDMIVKDFTLRPFSGNNVRGDHITLHYYVFTGNTIMVKLISQVCFYFLFIFIFTVIFTFIF